MNLTYEKTKAEDAACIFAWNKQLIETYEDLESIDYARVLKWVKQKIERHLCEYVTVYADGEKAGFYRFFKNEIGKYELDDLYILPTFQRRGIGTAVIERCCAQAEDHVMLYVFLRNERAITLYQRLGFRPTQNVHRTRQIMERAK